MKEKKLSHKARITMNYLLYLPKRRAAAGGRFPLLLFLHGAGERGSNLNLVKRHGPPRMIENGIEFPFIVAAPQCPKNTWWQTEPLAALLEHLLKRYPIDRRRIYLSGLSMGGYGTWALANTCPEKFAAIAPICGPQALIDPGRLKKIPVWCFHGAMDDIVPIEHSLKMVRQIRNAGGDARLTIYPEAGHDAWTQAYSGNELYDWLLSHQKKRMARTGVRRLWDKVKNRRT